MLIYLYAAVHIEKNAWLCIMVEAGMLWKRQKIIHSKKTAELTWCKLYESTDIRVSHVNCESWAEMNS